MAELVSHNDGFELWRHERASREFRKQIATTTFGSGGLRYRRLDVDQQIRRLGNASFFELRQDGNLVATYVIVPTPLRLGAERIEGNYRGLLTVSPSRQSAGIGRHIVSQTLAHLRAAQADGTRISWGCIDRNNTPSRRLLKALGAVRLGTLSTRLVYRQFPRRVEGVVEISDDALVEGELSKTYQDCGLCGIRPLRSPGSAPMTGYMDDGSIVAAARAELVRLDLASVGSRWYARYGKLIDLLGPARRRFDPRDFRYLRLSDVIASTGNGHRWRALLGELLRRHDAHMAMFCLDEKSRVFSTLADARLFGRLADISRQQIDVFGTGVNLAEDQIDALRDAPIALQAFDL